RRGARVLGAAGMSATARPVALVTGASRGIGAETAKLLAAAGYDVGINYRRDAEGAQAVLEQIAAAGGSAWICRADVASEDEVKAMFAAVDARGAPLKALVNNAAVLFPQTTLDGIGA